MKLKTRLIIAFFIITCVPLLLACIVAVGVSQFQFRAIENRMGISNVTFGKVVNTLQMLTEATDTIYDEMQTEADENPGIFLDEQYQNELNNKLKNSYSFLVVRSDDNMVYSGIEGMTVKMFQELPEYGASNYKMDGGYIGNDIQSFVRQVDMELPDGAKGSAFIITSLREAIPQLEVLVLDLGVAIVLILIVTAACMSAWIYRGVNSPLKKLKEATQHIKEGDLDFALDVKGNDELSQLCQDFEAMRRQLKITNEEKNAYDRENKELISNISHDLKTPITAVKGYVEGIMDGVADTPEKMDRYIRTIYNKANDMDKLINELTFYSKIDTNRIPYTFNKINVAEYFDDCVEEVGLDLESKNIELSYFNYVDHDTLVIADAEQLKRVISNIIGNSIKYLDKPKGYISIRVKDVGDFIQVEIEDNGKGIAAKDLPNIFDRFYRTDASRNSSQGGSGIGLSIVKKIIEDHGGKIWANSKLGAGTIMYFVLRKYQEVPINE